jgi:c-di-GMP-binding flagellar brake protein YcgR
MEFKRIYVRVPLHGEAILSHSNKPTIKARTINISQGGVAVAAFSEEVLSAEYQIEIFIEPERQIKIFAQLVRLDDSVAAFQFLQADPNSVEVIKNLVFEYEETLDFIENLDEFNLLDEEGNEIEITFEEDSNNNQ